MNNNPDENQILEDKKFKIKQIPLKVKKAKSPKKIKKVESNISSFKLLSTIKIVLVLLLLLLNTLLIINIAVKKDTNNKNSTLTKEKTSTKVTKSDSTLGNWKTNNDGLFSFQDDTFYWYDSYKYQEDNYYSGTYTFKNGQDALDEMGYTEDDAKTYFGENIKIENIYSIVLKPNTVYKAGIDTTKRDLNEDTTWWYVLVIKDNNKALGYNKTLDLRYDLTKY